MITKTKSLNIAYHAQVTPVQEYVGHDAVHIYTLEGEILYNITIFYLFSALYLFSAPPTTSIGTSPKISFLEEPSTTTSTTPPTTSITTSPTAITSTTAETESKLIW